jgi:hypothetical protein
VVDKEEQSRRGEETSLIEVTNQLFLGEQTIMNLYVFGFRVIHTRLKLQKRKGHLGFVMRFFQCRIIRVVRQNNTQHLVLPLSVLYSIYREPKLLMPSVPSDFSEQQRRRQAETGT